MDQTNQLANYFQQRLLAQPVILNPMAHVVIDDPVPAETFQELLAALPPQECFTPPEKVKRSWRPDRDPAPERCKTAWNHINEEWLAAVMPHIVGAFKSPLHAHCADLFGPAQADEAIASMTVRTGRLMLRRPGYELPPHRDPLPGFVTLLWHLTQMGGDATYGTQIYAVSDDVNAPYSKTYYPPRERCTLVSDVPYRPNRAMIFLNTPGAAHGASIPAGASTEVERYSYQAYIGVDVQLLPRLVARLPPSERARWAEKYHPAPA
jgi:hypothetical protein